MTIYYLCPDEDRPTGGVKQIYRHVDILNRHGFEAYVLHFRRNFRCSWFNNRTAIRSLNKGSIRGILSNVTEKLNFLSKSEIYPGCAIFDETKRDGAKFELTTSDIIVLPEYSGKWLNQIIEDLPFIIFNQSFFLTFNGYSLKELYVNGIYHEPNLKGVIAVSRHDEEALQYVFSHVDIYRIHNGINPEIFYPSQTKKKQIVFIPRKCPEDVFLLMNIIQCRGKLKGWNWVPIENLSQSEAAGVLRESLIYLNFARREGFGLPPLEAALCGCAVIGYDGVAGREFFNEDHAYRIPYGDVIRFSKTIEEVVEQIDSGSGTVEKKVKRFMEFAKKCYSLEQEEKDVVQTWGKILSC